jgi:hypothetical protein
MSGWTLKRGAREVRIPNEATLLKWADEGRIKLGDLIFHPHLQRWLYSQDVLEIHDALQKVRGVTATSTPPSGSPASQDDHARQVQLSSKDFVIRQAGRDFRAPDVATLRGWAREGRIRPDSYVFHPVLNRWAYARELAELENSFRTTSTNITRLAVSYRQLVLWVGLQILISLGLLLFDSLSPLLVPALVATIIALAFYAFRTAEALGSPSAPLWAVAMLIPCINVITLLVLSSNATGMCRANGVPVGFFGPRV